MLYILSAINNCNVCRQARLGKSKIECTYLFRIICSVCSCILLTLYAQACYCGIFLLSETTTNLTISTHPILVPLFTILIILLQFFFYFTFTCQSKVVQQSHSDFSIVGINHTSRFKIHLFYLSNFNIMNIYLLVSMPFKFKV